MTDNQSQVSLGVCSNRQVHEGGSWVDENVQTLFLILVRRL